MSSAVKLLRFLQTRGVVRSERLGEYSFEHCFERPENALFGFDSIPFDLGVYMLQKEATEKFGKPAPRVKGRVRAMAGTFSGGTAASLTATMKSVAKNPKLIPILQSPFGLTPGFEGPDQPMGLVPEYDETIGKWAAPFIMATINTKNVHRTNFLLGHPYGEDPIRMLLLDGAKPGVPGAIEPILP